jgi:hypothetical protein
VPHIEENDANVVVDDADHSNASNDESINLPPKISGAEIQRLLREEYAKGRMSHRTLNGVLRIFIAAGHGVSSTARLLRMHVLTMYNNSVIF